MSKIVMYTHGGSENHGCEAIVRTTSEIFQEIDDYPILLSYNIEEDMKYGLHNLVEVRQEIGDINKKSIDFIKAYCYQKIKHNYHYMDSLMHKKAIDDLSMVDIALFVGGDNYCYSDAKNYKIVNHFIRKKANKIVLWGASVEPELLDDKDIKEDIRKFDFIVARESLSYEALKKVNKNICLLPDPAFFLPVEEVKLPEKMGETETIGINVSPLVMKLERKRGRILKNYERLIEHILKNTDYQIALIPHVVWKSNDDREPLKYLYARFKESNRVILINDHNCMQQKYIISKCKIFIGARTHATIAAYSTGIPTLVVGYSVKARGIAKDLFGTEEHYVISAQNLENEDELIKAYEWIANNERLIREKLIEKKEEYRELKSNYLKGIV